MALIQKLIEKMQRHPKRIVFPEGNEPRVIQAARQFATRRMGVPILIGDRTSIKESAARLDIQLDGIRLLEPERSEDMEQFTVAVENLRRYKGLKEVEAKVALNNPTFFAVMMLATNHADAMVGGPTGTAISTLRPLFQIIPRLDGVQTASSMMMLDFDDSRFGIDGTLFLADCGIIPDPTAEQLADVALATARIAHHLTDATPRVAMLGHATHSTGTSSLALAKVKAATEIARDRARKGLIEMEIDGELQVDAALCPETARGKGLSDSVAGRANVLVFPDLNSGNIGSKLVQILAGVNTYGQIITGMSKPAAKISHRASAHDILGTATIVGCQAIDHRLLYG